MHRKLEHRRFSCAIVLVGILLLAFPLLSLRAQTVTGTILGNVLDASGAAVPNTEITVTNQDTGVARTATSTSDGVYTVPSLLAGRYSVEARAQGFTPTQVKDIVVNVGSNARVDFALQVGQVTQQVTVTEALPTVETTSSEVSQVMDANLIAAIPLNSRDLQQLAQVQPSVVLLSTGSYGKTLSVGGDRFSNNRFLQEGVDMTTSFRQSPVSLASNILMGAEGVKEFQVITENPPVEYGEESGGVINTIFKSGTNNFHGSAFEYYRNSALDARNFFDITSEPPPLHRHQYGGSIGGPIRKDKTFFFADFEGLHDNEARTDVEPNFDAAARGNGSIASCGPAPSLFACPTGVATGTNFNVGQLPCGVGNGANCPGGTPVGALVNVPVSPVVSRIFFGGYGGNPGVPLLPTCNGGEILTSGQTAGVPAGLPTGSCALDTNPIAVIRENYGVIKIDHALSSKDTLSGTYNMDQSTSYTPVQTTINADNIYFRQQTGSVQWTRIVSANVVNTFRFGIHRLYYAGNMDLTVGQGGISKVDPALFVNPDPFIVQPRSPFPQLPQITTGISGLILGATSQPGSNFIPRYIGYTSGNLDESVNWLRGKHAMQFGFQVHDWYDNNENYQSNPRGTLAFPNEAAFLSAITNQTYVSLAIPYYTDPLNNQTYVGSIARGEHLMAYGVYAEDTFKLKPNLTVTAGLRWEYAGAPQEEHNRISNLWGRGDPPSCNPYTCATATLGAPWYHPPKDNFAPRLGINWDPFKKGTTSIRAGAGIFYTELEDSYWYPSIAFQYPYTASVSVPNTYWTANCSGTPVFPFINVGTPGSVTSSNSCLNKYLASLPVPSTCTAGAPTGFCLPTTLQSEGGVENPYFKTATKYAFNFAIQHELPGHLTVEVAYVGSQGRHLGRTMSYADFFPTTTETPGQLPAVNGVAIPGSVVNPNCTAPGEITCYYWAGQGLNNANLLATSTANYSTLYGPYAYACQGGKYTPPCYNNPNWASGQATGQNTDANSMYNSMQVIVERRVSPGLLARFNYTWAKCITDSSFEQPTGLQNGGSTGWPLIYIANAARGRCAFSPTNSANLTLGYVTHWGNNLNSKVAKTLVANWELTSQTLVQSGLSFTITEGQNVSRYATTTNAAGTDRPDWAAPNAACHNPNPNGAVNANWKQTGFYLNSACFAPAAPGYLGDIGNMSFTGPTIFSIDMSLRKTIAVSESKSFIFSADMFNAFNRANITPPASSAVNTTAGAPNTTFSIIGVGLYFPTTTTSRQFQIGGRFIF